jgi:hypothetical protein
MPLRKQERFHFNREAKWDFFSSGTGRKPGFIADISKTGCLLKTSDPIPHRQWIRMLVKDHESNLVFTWVGRVVRAEHAMEAQKVAGGSDEITLYSYGVEFTFPDSIALQDFDLILALSSKNLSVDSCRSLNSMSS